jgi:hypothetical protein
MYPRIVPRLIFKRGGRCERFGWISWILLDFVGEGIIRLVEVGVCEDARLGSLTGPVAVFRVDFGCSLRGSGVDLRDFGQFEELLGWSR